MKHFSRAQWQNFNRHSNGAEAALMEAHLQTCQQCQELFLECIEQVELERAEALITPDFTAQTLERVKKAGRKKQPKMQSAGGRLLAYYTAAAVLTLILTGGGVLQSLSSRLIWPEFYPQIHRAISYERVFYDWPTQLREKASGWMDEIDVYNKGR